MFFFDTRIPEIADFIGGLGVTATQAYTCVDTLEGIKRKELVTIGDLNTYISNSNEQVIISLSLLWYNSEVFP